MDIRTLGATVNPGGVDYCLWAPETDNVTVDILRQDGPPQVLAMTRDARGYHTVRDRDGRAGDAYGFRLMGGPLLPDPASRAQQEDAHGRSLVVDASSFPWQDAAWRRPPFRDLVIYEIHIGTFTPEGTFRQAATRLPYLRSLGITAVEIMPIADFPGSRNWGYDGVLIYAPERHYGTPDDLRHFVDQAHSHGIAVILDVVYNHFGPDGNYLSTYSPHYFTEKHHTPWGNAFNFDSEMAGPVRDFFLQNPPYWMENFHIDGFRFDATHQIPDDSEPHILQELASIVQSRGGYAIAEDERNEVRMITPRPNGGFGFNAVWADDFHHSSRVAQTREDHSYFQDFRGNTEELVSILQHGWLYRGQFSRLINAPRGTDASLLPPECFVHCISNHDQVGNRAFGERLNHIIPLEAYRALSMLICLTPYTPMLFMGQEWAAATPFLFFTEHEIDLGRKITEGRRKEFALFPEFADESLREKIPDPQALATFENSRLNWDELHQASHSEILELYSLCLRVRRENPAFRPIDRSSWRVRHLPWGAAELTYSDSFLLIFDLEGGHSGTLQEGWHLMLSSNIADPGWDSATRTISFTGPHALLFRRSD